MDRRHVWHPFTPMAQWRGAPQLLIQRGQGPYVFDSAGKRYIDGVSSLWCNVHGHCVPQIDQAIKDQLDQIAHSTLLGLASGPSAHLAKRLCDIAPGQLNKVFFSDSGATAVEVAFKMAVSYWFHLGKPNKNRFIGLQGAYHGDTTGAMSVGFSPLFHRPFVSMVFETTLMPCPDICRDAQLMQQFSYGEKITSATEPGATKPSATKRGASPFFWPSEDVMLNSALRDRCLQSLEKLLVQQADQTAALVIEPMVQGAAGMIVQPPGFLKGIADLAKKYNVLLIADEVATGFGRTGKMFACEHEAVEPDLLCAAKGITGGYLPLAATLCTDAIEAGFEGKTFYHGHTYTGNALACAAAIASLDLFESTDLLAHVAKSAKIIEDKLHALRCCSHVQDIRQRGLMVGIELCQDRATRLPFDFASTTGAKICLAMREQGLLLRPLGDVIVLMPVLAMPHDVLEQMLEIVVQCVLESV